MGFLKSCWSWMVGQHPWLSIAGGIALARAIGRAVKWWYDIKRARREERDSKLHSEQSQINMVILSVMAKRNATVFGMRDSEIAEATGYSVDTVASGMTRQVADGLVRHLNERWYLNEKNSVTNRWKRPWAGGADTKWETES